MKIHVLPGDSLHDNFKETNIQGEIVICRECLIEGVVKAESLEEFWKVRADFIESAYGEDQDKYYKKIVWKLKKLSDLSTLDEVNLWFENELFCQANMWFCLYILQKTGAKIYRVSPIVKTDENIWKGFGYSNAEELKKCFAARTKFNNDELLLGANLWNSFQSRDYEKLKNLSETKSACFPYLKEVCRAEIEKQFYPKEVLRAIKKDDFTTFTEVFSEFSNPAGIYGFGDEQVKRIWQEI